MKRRNRNLRVLLVAAVLLLAIGATQAAVIPRASDGSETRSQRTHATRSLHYWVTSVLRLVNLGDWFTPMPNPAPVLQPPSPDLPPNPTPFNAPVDPDATCTRKTVDDNHPF